jgi:hypothetical protein
LSTNRHWARNIIPQGNRDGETSSRAELEVDTPDDRISAAIFATNQFIARQRQTDYLTKTKIK